MTALPVYREGVRAEWIDYNGHLSEAFYVLVFGHATDAMMAAVGLGPEHREASGCSLYTVEAHVRYLDEVDAGAELAVRTRVLGVAGKKVRFVHEMSVGDAMVATEELFALYVDQGAGGAVSLPEEVRGRLEELIESAPESAPEWAGRGIRVV